MRPELEEKKCLTPRFFAALLTQSRMDRFLQQLMLLPSRFLCSRLPFKVGHDPESFWRVEFFDEKESTCVSDLPNALSETLLGVSAARGCDGDILDDPAVQGLERMLRVKARLETVPAAGTTVTSTGRRVVSGGAQTAHATAGESKEVIELHEVHESEVLDAQAQKLCIGSGAAEMAAHATAGESQRIIGLRERCESDFPYLNSSRCLGVVACARLPAVPGVSAFASSCASAPVSFAVVAHARSTPMHVARNSWSDTGRVKGPRGRKRVKGGVSGPAEDLRPVSEVEAGVTFRPAGGVRGQVAGSLPRWQPGTGTRQVKGSLVTPSLHPEVPGIQFVSPGYGLDIRQSMGWTKVCGSAQSGIWVLKGNARTRMLLTTFGWNGGSRVHTRLPGLRQGATVCVHTSMDMEQQSDPKPNNAIWDGVSGLWDRVAPFLSPWCGKKDVPTGVNLNHYAGSGSFIRWHSDDEPLFGPQNSPKLIVSLSLGNSVEFMVRRRAPGKVPSSSRLDHGDVLVMDGLAQSESEHCAASELQGPRVNLTYRWVAQHTASCPVAGVVVCVLPTCAQGLVEPSSRSLGEGENKWSSPWGLVLLLLILVSVSVHPARLCTSPLGVVPAGLGDGVGDCHGVGNLPRVCLFISLVFFEKTLLFSSG